MSVTNELDRLVREYDETARAHEAARLALAEGMLAAHRGGMTKTELIVAMHHRFTWTTLERLLKAAAGIEGQPEGDDLDRLVRERPLSGPPGHLRRKAAAEAGIVKS